VVYEARVSVSLGREGRVRMKNEGEDLEGGRLMDP
jgi:hypothetical protein